MINLELSINSKSKSKNEIAHNLEEAMAAFSDTLDIPVTYFNAQGKISWTKGDEKKLCNDFTSYGDNGSLCRQSLDSAIKIASQHSEPYIFICKSGLAKIAFALMIQKQYVGCMVIGPFILGQLKSSIISNIFSLNNIKEESYAKIIMKVNTLKTFSPKHITNISTLFKNSILGALILNDDYSNLDKDYEELRKINKNLQLSKRENKMIGYPHKIEGDLIDFIKKGDVAKSKELFDSFITELSIYELGNITAIKTMILGICVMLSKNITENTAVTQEEIESRLFDIEEINGAENLYDLTTLTSNYIFKIAEFYDLNSYAGDSALIKQSIQFINEKYSQKVTLHEAAIEMHTSDSYLSTLFKREMGTTFTNYLNQIRIKKSCDLLANTDLSLFEISGEVGFDDQSYFSKVFKKICNTTPKEYRKTKH